MLINRRGRAMKKANYYAEGLKNTLYKVSHGMRKVLVSFTYFDNVLSSSNNYIQRFLAFIISSQMMYLLLFIICKIFILFGWSAAIPIVILIFLGIGISLLLIFLFISVKAKSMTFFISGAIYFVLTILIAGKLRIESIIIVLSEIVDLSFMSGWAFWNLTYSTVLILIGTSRTFLLGFVHDYKYEETKQNDSKEENKDEAELKADNVI
jgi:hypothetical protein